MACGFEQTFGNTLSSEYARTDGACAHACRLRMVRPISEVKKVIAWPRARRGLRRFTYRGSPHTIDAPCPWSRPVSRPGPCPLAGCERAMACGSPLQGGTRPHLLQAPCKTTTLRMGNNKQEHTINKHTKSGNDNISRYSQTSVLQRVESRLASPCTPRATVGSHDFNSRVSNLRTMADVHFRMPFGSSNLPGSGPMFAD